VDDFGGAEKAVEYLISRGYKRIAHIAGPDYISIGKDRLKGYKSALKKHGIPYQEELVIHGSGFGEENGTIGFQKLIQLPQYPDAIFAVNYPVAIGVFMQIKEKGFKIPDDIALMDFGDSPVVSLVEPPLSTVSQPTYKIGQIATKILLEEIENKKEFVPRIKKLKTKIIIRKST
jgi:DNA-binding LacI/PurR family transcriptional regulator